MLHQRAANAKPAAATGLHLTQSGPPIIDAIAAGFSPTGQPSVAIAGRNLNPETRILFDGQLAPVAAVGGSGILFVSPPPAASGHEATVVALNPDGQSSLFVQGGDAPRWSYADAADPLFSVTPRSLEAGSEAMIEIRGANTSFRQGLSQLGFGSSDVVVRDLWVLDEDYLVANVFVAANAEPAVVSLSVVTGLEVTTQVRAFQLLPDSTREPVVHSPAFHPESDELGVSAGGIGAIQVSGLTASDGVTITINDRVAPVLAVENSVVTFQVPADLEPGPAVLRLSSATGDAAPVVIRIEAAPPAMAAIFGADGSQINGGRDANPGEILTLVVLGFVDDEELISPDRLQVEVGGIAHSVHQVIPLPGLPGARSIQFFLGTKVPAGPLVPIRLSFDGRVSAPVYIGVAAGG
ncbi:MAG: hypothetical protein GY953_00930 [bacterium]|nr:hypothetical protein [bacterium]